MTTTGKCFGKEFFINALPTYREGVFAFENRDFPMPDLSAWERERDLWCYILTPWDYTDTAATARFHGGATAAQLKSTCRCSARA